MTMVLSEESPRPLVKVRAQMLPPGGPSSPDSTPPPRLTREPNNNSTPVTHHHHHGHGDISRTDFKMRPPPAPKSALHKHSKGEFGRQSAFIRGDGKRASAF